MRFLQRINYLRLNTLEITYDGNMIYTCSNSMVVCQIDLSSLRKSFVHQGFWSAVVLPDGEAILSGTFTDSSFNFTGNFHLNVKSNICRYVNRSFACNSHVIAATHFTIKVYFLLLNSQFFNIFLP